MVEKLPLRSEAYQSYDTYATCSQQKWCRSKRITYIELNAMYAVKTMNQNVKKYLASAFKPILDARSAVERIPIMQKTHKK